VSRAQCSVKGKSLRSHNLIASSSEAYLIFVCCFQSHNLIYYFFFFFFFLCSCYSIGIKKIQLRKAEPDTDEVYAQVTLVPELSVCNSESECLWNFESELKIVSNGNNNLNVF
jgi:hypothetical protein